jgi:hypothetical protein
MKRIAQKDLNSPMKEKLFSGILYIEHKDGSFEACCPIYYPSDDGEMNEKINEARRKAKQSGLPVWFQNSWITTQISIIKEIYKFELKDRPWDERTVMVRVGPNFKDIQAKYLHKE